MATPQDVMKLVKENDVKFVDFRFTDTRGNGLTASRSWLACGAARPDAAGSGRSARPGKLSDFRSNSSARGPDT